MAKNNGTRFEVFTFIQLSTKKVVYAETAEEAVGKILDNTVEEEQKYIPTGGFISDLRMLVNSKSSPDCATFQALLETPDNAKNFKFKLSKQGEQIGETKGTFVEAKAMVRDSMLNKPNKE